MKMKEQKKLSKTGLQEAQRKFRERCKKPLPPDVSDLISEATKEKKQKNEDRAAKGLDPEKSPHF